MGIISIPHHPRPLSFFLRHIRRLRLGLIILQRAAACSCAHCHCQIVVLGSPASSARPRLSDQLFSTTHNCALTDTAPLDPFYTVPSPLSALAFYTNPKQQRWVAV